MSEDSIIELYGKELVAIHKALKDILWTKRSPAERKHIKHFVNRYDVKLAIELCKEDSKEW